MRRLHGSTVIPLQLCRRLRAGGVRRRSRRFPCRGSIIGLALVTAGIAAPPAVGAPYVEIGAPLGRYRETAPKGWVMLVHGGAWRGVGVEQVVRIRREADRFRRQGWATANIDYRAGSQSLRDVIEMYDRLRERVGPSVAVCLFGQSAGGQLSLMTAIARPSVSCIITEAAPTDLAGLGRQRAYSAATGGRQSVGPRWTFGVSNEVWGRGNLRAASPLTWASRLRVETLMATATTDELIPLSQMAALHAARPRIVTTLRVAGSRSTRPGGRSLFTHAYITPAARRAWEAAKRRLLARAWRSRRG